LRGDEQVSLYIPAGCAHGFQALTEPADVSYRIDRPHDPSEDLSIAYDDRDLGIPWPQPVTLLSKRDQSALSLSAGLALLTAPGGRQDAPGPGQGDATATAPATRRSW